MNLAELEFLSIVDAFKLVLHNGCDIKYGNIEIVDLRKHLPSKANEDKPWLQITKNKSTKIKKNNISGNLEFVVNDNEESVILHNYNDAVVKFLEYRYNERL